MPSEERDTRIPYRLGTNGFCRFEGCDEYVHMGDFVVVDTIFEVRKRCGRLRGVEYNDEGFLSFVKLACPHEAYGYYVVFDGVFRRAEVTDD